MNFNSDEWIVTSIDMVVQVGKHPIGMKEFGPRRFHGLVCQLEGVTRYAVEGQAPLLHQPEQILYLPQDIPYKVYGVESNLCIAVNFHLLNSPSLPGFIFQPRTFTLWRNVFHEILSAWNAQRTGHMTRCRSMLYQMLAMLSEQMAEQGLPQTRLKEIAAVGEYLQSNLSDPDLSIEVAAERVNLSATHLRNQFRQVYGMPPKQYLTNLRLSLARELLVTTSLPVTDIAARCGYDSLYNFSRSFRMATGLSPSAYREET